MASVQIFNSDALSALKMLDSKSVDCIVTSPPYWGLRAYGGEPGMIGLEPTFCEYLDNLLDVFQECHRVLKSSGTMWVNMGDRRCILAGCPPSGTVLDPFAGSGTTPSVAASLGMHAVAIEISSEYCELIKERIQKVQLPIRGLTA